MPFQGNSFIRNQNFIRDRDLGPPDSTISADKMDDEIDNLGAGLTVAKTQAATAESKAGIADGKAVAAQTAIDAHAARADDPHGTALATALAPDTDLDTVVAPGLYWVATPTSPGSAGLPADSYIVRVFERPGGGAAPDLVQLLYAPGAAFYRSRTGNVWRTNWAHRPIESTAFARGLLLRDSPGTARDFLDVHSRGETDAAVAAAAATAVPSGAVMPFAMSAPPSGWLKADGAAISRLTYADLFAAIGTTHGAGDGATTFNLPDLRGEFVRGWDDGRGVDGGRAFGSMQSDSIKEGRFDIRVDTGGSPLASNPTGSVDFSSLGSTTITAQGTATQRQATRIYIGRFGVETRPRNIAMLYCIKA